MKRLLSCLLSFLFFLLVSSPAYAIVDPLTQPNNRFGIHIFDSPELEQVPELVNSNHGQWGYVTVPIRADDRNREKWNAFMHQATEKKLIPIVRMATTMTPTGWARPDKYMIVDTANFLNDLDWPVKNRYVIVYNEPNHATEWGGTVDPEHYAEILAYTAQALKERNDDFFILPAGLDAAAPSDEKHLNWKTFLQRMHAYNPSALQSIDGWNSHSYPNPAFSRPPTDRHDHSIYSFYHETQLVASLTNKQLPIFITETGWSTQALSDELVAQYYQQAFTTVWNDSRIIAVTPFVLHAGAGPFVPFSLIDANGTPKAQYRALASLKKIKGEPVIGNDQDSMLAQVLGETAHMQPPATPQTNLEKSVWKQFFKWFGD